MRLRTLLFSFFFFSLRIFFLVPEVAASDTPIAGGAQSAFKKVTGISRSSSRPIRDRRMPRSNSCRPS